MPYINKLGGVVSKTLSTLYEWAILRSLTLRAIHRLGINNKLADYLSRNRPAPTEWHLSLLIAQSLFQVWGRPQVELLASHRNHQLPLWFCRTSHPFVAASNTLSQPWKRLYICAYPPIPLLQRTLITIREDQAEETIVITPTGQGDSGTTFSSRWHARSHSCFHADGISYRNTCLTMASSTTLTWRPSS